jgi:pimeloyl-ACP methyl ester carboxylesterase
MSPTRTAESKRTDRFDVSSDDGTRIAVWVDGDGPPLVMVHGSLQDHTASGALVEVLRGDLTTFAMDRRGFGASGDAPGYALEREFEDVAAVVDAVAARTGGAVALWGHSYGASCAMGGAALTTNVHQLVLYEPSLALTFPEGSLESLERKLAAGEKEVALVEFLVEITGMTEAELQAMRTNPYMSWSERVETVPMLVRECIAEEAWVYRPGQFDAIAARTLLLAGSTSPPLLKESTRAAAQAIPGAHVHVLEGEGHFAHRNDPAAVAAIVRQFLGS